MFKILKIKIKVQSTLCFWWEKGSNFQIPKLGHGNVSLEGLLSPCSNGTLHPVKKPVITVAMFYKMLQEERKTPGWFEFWVREPRGNTYFVQFYGF